MHCFDELSDIIVHVGWNLSGRERGFAAGKVGVLEGDGGLVFSFRKDIDIITRVAG